MLRGQNSKRLRGRLVSDATRLNTEEQFKKAGKKEVTTLALISSAT
jgi:hypothetical protein